MDRRSPNQIAESNLSAAEDAAGITAVTVRSRLSEGHELTFGDLLDAGGVLFVSPGRFLEGVPSA